MAFIRGVKTSSGATAIQIAYVVINGQEYIADEDISPAIHTLLQKLRSGH
ncbi:hypothetical protein KKE78_02175 [Patescibacteria group bacterium]|nr:hypothetical protein [Patescibacteria group bacterium]